MSEQVLLFSGGIDSYIAWHYLQKPKTVYFDLGTPYSQYEIQVIKELIPDTIIDRSLNLASRQIPSPAAAHVPMRNLYLAMLACKYGDEIIICGLKDDKVNDKTPEAFKEMSTLLTNFNDKKIYVTSPFWHKTKADIVEWFLKFCDSLTACDSEALLKTISCYTPDKDVDNARYCGRCSCCFRKWNALYVNGIKLPFYNFVLMKEYLDKAKHSEYETNRCTTILHAILEFVREGNYLHLGKEYRVDIDGVLTNEIEGHDYEMRTPNQNNIARVNDIYQQGARIILWTSRYAEDEEITRKWLKENKVYYDELILDKPHYDKIIDDKCIDLDRL
jgi:7-cyano-7-deazaguanine synthase in queuosine biosynthesis